MRLDRHDFVVLDRSWKQGAIFPPSCFEAVPDQITSWLASGKPMVVASRSIDDPTDMIRLGLATPKKTRLSVLVEKQVIESVKPPPSLEAAKSSAPEEWRTLIETVADVAARFGIEVRVFGSLGWQCVSQMKFVHERSDLDLLLVPGSGCDVRGAIRAMLSVEGAGRLDGEVVLSDRSAVNLRELDAAPDQVLVKRHGGPALRRLADVERLLERRS